MPDYISVRRKFFGEFFDEDAKYLNVSINSGLKYLVTLRVEVSLTLGGEKDSALGSETNAMSDEFE